MRVALLYPEVYDMARFKEHRKEFPPFGVLYLAAVIEQAGHNVAIKKVTPRTTCLELRHYDVVGFSLASSATYGFMREARDRSTIHKDAVVMVGGVHCNFYPLDTLKDFAHMSLLMVNQKRRYLKYLTAQTPSGLTTWQGCTGGGARRSAAGQPVRC
ncbi:MAG: cobalamin-dependent protein [Pseudonocardiales bacterium]